MPYRRDVVIGRAPIYDFLLRCLTFGTIGVDTHRISLDDPDCATDVERPGVIFDPNTLETIYFENRPAVRINLKGLLK